jgi:hypothetical protein
VKRSNRRRLAALAAFCLVLGVLVSLGRCGAVKAREKRPIVEAPPTTPHLTTRVTPRPVPEPSTYALGGAFVLFALAIRRVKRHP